MIVEKVLGNIGEFGTDKKQVKVFFEWFELEKKRLSKIAEDGTKLGVCIPELIKEGDILAQTEDNIYIASVVPSHLIKIKVSTMTEMGRLGFELGNRHLSLQISEGEVKVPFDEPTFLYLKKLGFQAEEVTESFTDFIECKAHGHSHSHEHEEKSHTHAHIHKEEEVSIKESPKTKKLFYMF